MKTLGVQWNAETDELAFKLNVPDDIGYTKRGFLKVLAMLFDPLQMLAPFVVRGKIMLQEAWLLDLDWDEEFPVELEGKCREWFTQLPDLVQLPRCLCEACIFRTDSIDVVCWIQRRPGKFKPFVTNQIYEIQQKSSPSQLQ